jgi:cell division septal protein FtsQ
VAAVVLGGIFVAIACVFMAWRATDWTLKLLFYENNVFAITDLDVQTDGVIAPDQLRRWSGVRPGKNLFALDLADVRRNLLLVSMIQSVSLEKILPHTLRVRVVEREPVAQFNVARVRSGGGLELAPLYLDPEAFVISPLTPSQCSAGATGFSNEQLPTIVGVNGNDLQPGHRVEAPPIRAALELILAFQRSPMQGLADLKKVDVSMPDVLVAKTSQGSEITFGQSELDQQLLRWQSIFEWGQKTNKAIATLDLAVSNSIPATWVDANSVPQGSVKTPRSFRNRKKHV